MTGSREAIVAAPVTDFPLPALLMGGSLGLDSHQVIDRVKDDGADSDDLPELLHVPESAAAVPFFADRDRLGRADEGDLGQLLGRGTVQINGNPNRYAGEPLLAELLHVGQKMLPGRCRAQRIDPLDLRVAGESVEQVGQIQCPGVIVMGKVPDPFPLGGHLDRGKGRVGEAVDVFLAPLLRPRVPGEHEEKARQEPKVEPFPTLHYLFRISSSRRATISNTAGAVKVFTEIINWSKSGL